jgi:hypothetical protein
LLIENIKTGQLEAFYAFYQKPLSMCNGNKVVVGDSFLVRIATDLNTGLIKKVVSVTKYSGMFITGISLVGGGADVVYSTSGQDTQTAAVNKLSNQPLQTSPQFATGVTIESFREVRP